MTKAEEAGALLPCPFCGGEAERIELEDAANFGGTCIGCKQCGASSPVHFDRKENLLSSWNERASPHMGGPTRATVEQIVGVVAQSLGPLSPTERADLIEEIASLFPPQPERTGEVVGWKLAPVAPTAEMIRAAEDYRVKNTTRTWEGDYAPTFAEIYRVALSAAPPPPACQDHERD